MSPDGINLCASQTKFEVNAIVGVPSTLAPSLPALAGMRAFAFGNIRTQSTSPLLMKNRLRTDSSFDRTSVANNRICWQGFNVLLSKNLARVSKEKMTQEEQNRPGEHEAHFLRGSLWILALRWTVRLIGLVSTVILARLLSPADFGVVAIAMIVVNMLDMLRQTGEVLAIIRHPNPTREHYDSAWTVSVATGCLVGILIFVVAPFTGYYFHDSRSIIVMQILALRALIGGFENIGTLDFRRELRFDRLYLFNFYPKIVSFVVTVILAFVLRNYWALVAGILVGQLASNVLGYVMQPYRPRFSVSKVREIWSFSIWSLIRNIGSYLNGQVDVIAVGGISSSAALGRYSVADDLASSPINELNGPLIAALYPVLAKIQHLPDKSRELYLRAVGWSAVICSSASVGVALVAPDLVYVVLGKKWLDAIPLLGWLALGAGILGLSSGAYGTLDAFGLPHVGARMQWVRLVFLVLIIAPVALIWRDAQSIAIARVCVAAVFIPTLFLSVGRVLNVPPIRYLSALWRPFAAAATMAVGVSALNLGLHDPPIVRLAIDVIAGATLYIGAIMTFWYLSKKPSSPEQDVYTYLGTAFGSVRTRFQW